MTTYTAKFLTDMDFAKEEFDAETPEHALARARAFYAEHTEDLQFETYIGGMPVNQIEIFDSDGGEVAIWRDAETRLRFSSEDLCQALTAMTAAVQAVTGSWKQGHLTPAALLRALDATIPDAKAALTKAMGERS